jgi:hypothetical protein
MQERLYVDSPPLGTTKLSDWVRAHREKIGRQYTSEMQRRFDRVLRQRGSKRAHAQGGCDRSAL